MQFSLLVSQTVTLLPQSQEVTNVLTLLVACDFHRTCIAMCDSFQNSLQKVFIDQDLPMFDATIFFLPPEAICNKMEALVMLFFVSKKKDHIFVVRAEDDGGA